MRNEYDSELLTAENNATQSTQSTQSTQHITVFAPRPLPPNVNSPQTRSQSDLAQSSQAQALQAQSSLAQSAQPESKESNQNLLMKQLRGPQTKRKRASINIHVQSAVIKLATTEMTESRYQEAEAEYVEGHHLQDPQAQGTNS